MTILTILTPETIRFFNHRIKKHDKSDPANKAVNQAFKRESIPKPASHLQICCPQHSSAAAVSPNRSSPSPVPAHVYIPSRPSRRIFPYTYLPRRQDNVAAPLLPALFFSLGSSSSSSVMHARGKQNNERVDRGQAARIAPFFRASRLLFMAAGARIIAGREPIWWRLREPGP